MWSGTRVSLVFPSFQTTLANYLTEAFLRNVSTECRHKNGAENCLTRTGSNLQDFNRDPANGTFAASVSHDTTFENTSHRSFPHCLVEVCFVFATCARLCNTMAQVRVWGLGEWLALLPVKAIFPMNEDGRNP